MLIIDVFYGIWLKIMQLYAKYTSKPNFASQKIVNKNFVLIYKLKPVLTLDKSIYVVFSILHLRKLLM